MILTGSGWQILGMCLGWGFLGCLALNLWHFVRETVQVAQKLHQIPCSQCQFFTNNPTLKCTVHPRSALSEQAIHCPDFSIFNH